MVDRFRLVFLMLGLISMLVTIQLLIFGLSDQKEYQHYKYFGLILSLVGEVLLVAVYKKSTPVVKFVIVCVSIVPLLAVFTLMLSWIMPSYFPS